MTDSRNKGKRVELLCAKYLQSLGFDARRSQQYNGVGLGDVVIESMPNLHIECKGGYGADLGTKCLMDFVDQASSECDGKRWAVFWKPDRKPWRMTFAAADPPVLVTACGDAEIKTTLLWMGGRDA